MSDIKERVKQEIEGMKANLSTELLEKILEQEIANGEKLDKLSAQKDTQIKSQAKFEKKWQKAKMYSFYAMVISLCASLLSGVIDVPKDANTMYERAKNKIERLTGNFNE